MALLLSACASLPFGRPQLMLEQPGESLNWSREGRFVIRTMTPQGNERGEQGRFEWLEFSSAPQTQRNVLMLLGPIGQSVGALERSTQSLRAFDEQGMLLDANDQARVMTALFSNAADRYGALQRPDGPDVHRALLQITSFFQSISRSDQRSHETSIAMPQWTIHLRVVLDPPADTIESRK